MLQRRVLTSEPVTPMKPIRVLIEDPGLAASGVEIDAPGSVDVRICSGPSSDRAVCPLVVDGSCPLGPCDVVVSSLTGPWAVPVRAAWRDAGVTVTSPPVSGLSPDAKLRAQLGSAYQALFFSQYR